MIPLHTTKRGPQEQSTLGLNMIALNAIKHALVQIQNFLHVITSGKHLHPQIARQSSSRQARLDIGEQAIADTLLQVPVQQHSVSFADGKPACVRALHFTNHRMPTHALPHCSIP